MFISHIVGNATNNDAGSACSCCCRARRSNHYLLTILFPSTIRHYLSLSSNRQPCLSELLPRTATIPSQCTVPSGGILTAALPGHAWSVVWHHSTGFPGTTSSNPYSSTDDWSIPATVGQPSYASWSAAATGRGSAAGQRVPDATDAHGSGASFEWR